MLPMQSKAIQPTQVWYERFNTKVEVAESVGVSFDFEKIWEYCALEAHKAAYTLLKPDKQEAVRVSA